MRKVWLALKIVFLFVVGVVVGALVGPLIGGLASVEHGTRAPRREKEEKQKKVKQDLEAKRRAIQEATARKLMEIMNRQQMHRGKLN